MPGRFLTPEILDHLPADDPRAIRSRRDLRMINFLMGNERWFLKTASRFPAAAAKGITEIGAGDGALSRKLSQLFPDTSVIACDLAPPPANLPDKIIWKQGDLFESSPKPFGGILIANLFLHHFEGESLIALGEICDGFDVVISNEPARGKLPHLQGWLINPLVNHVTRHDMHVSIDAGFTANELPKLMGLPSKRWQICEHSTWRGAARMVACRL